MSGGLSPEDFGAFFHELWGYDAFPWQKRLAVDVCGQGWPGCLDLPTASGKTGSLDVAVFAMALQQRGPRRVFFVVDRRVVVDAAFERMQEIQCKLRVAKNGILKTVADRLRGMARCGERDEPLATYQMRGGIYRDDSWVRSPLQPTLVASTVDQVGSRLLFRGYGVWDKTLPIHAALVANDSLILLDEAHCSRPFSETLAAVQRYRGLDWAAEEPPTPFAYVQMTATPVGQSGTRFGLEDDDYQHPKMRKRLYAPKPARLVVSKARAKDFGKLAENLVDEALRLTEKPGILRVAVMVNRVRTARLAHAELQKRGRSAHLLIGRMRPVDRATLPAELQAILAGNQRTPDGKPVFVVSTQCLEVGADLDFDGIVTECASVDALLQRFGRLDRIGDLHESGVTAEGRVVIASPMTNSAYVDPIYAGALAKTWSWLKTAGDEADFGICSEAGTATVRERLQAIGTEAEGLRRDAPLGPVLLPAHLDALVQTSPRPALEPDVQLYLHGMESTSPEVQVVWRSDLDLDRPKQWGDIVGLCPPVSVEAMTVPLRDFRRWFLHETDDGSSSDIEGLGQETEVKGDDQSRCVVLRWRGDQSDLIESANDIRPGDTLILSTMSEGWDELGHIPADSDKDVAERARMTLRRGWVLRLHAKLMEKWPPGPALRAIEELIKQPTAGRDEVVQALLDYKDVGPVWLKEMLEQIPKRTSLEAYPSDDERPVGWVLSGRFVEADSGGDESSAGIRVSLDQHLVDVTQAVSENAVASLLDERIHQSLIRAAQLHDYGKADARFQALLYGGDPMAAQFAPKLLAKGDQARESRQVRKAQWTQSSLPDGFRHELISMLLARQGANPEEDDLVLHLIASHHGRCRPFAPMIVDDGEALEYDGRHITREQRTTEAAHRLESGVSDRFWKLTRQHGWWGLAYLESLLRLGDWKASKEEAKKESRR